MSNKNLAWPRNLEHSKFRFHMLNPEPFVNFSGPAGGCSLRARIPYMTRRALCLQSNTTPRVILRSIARHGDGIFRLHFVDLLETCKVVCRTSIFRHSNTFRWCHRSLKWSMRPTGEAEKTSRAPCMESRIFQNFMKN